MIMKVELSTYAFSHLGANALATSIRKLLWATKMDIYV